MRRLVFALVPSFAVLAAACSPGTGTVPDDGTTSSGAPVGTGSSGDGGGSSNGGARDGGGSSNGGAGDGGGSSSAGDGGSSSGGSSSGGPIDPVHDDGIKNGGETDVDCGGGEAPACAPNQDCELGARDCSSRVCVDALCTEPNDEDGVNNGDETGVDCGGPTSAKRCPPTQGCAAPVDCQQGVCTANVCAEPSAGDGVKNGGETGVDCGGPEANPRCAPGLGCGAAGDCSEGVCTAQLCAAATDADGVKNNAEKGVDCGGPNTTNTCAAGTACGEDLDCSSAACDHTGVCALYPSCKNHLGGDTCGSGETYDANRDHHSCCDTAAVTAAGNVKLDKYNITAGRMRAFVEATGGNIKAWIDAHPPASWVADWSNYLPTGLETPVKLVQSQNRNLGVYGQLGPNFVYDQAGQAGCWSGVAEGQAGAPTYWIPTANRQALNPNDQGSLYSQELLDQKALNCVNVVMLAAFCAWDGGRLPSIDELEKAWNGDGSRTYPWGNGPAPAGYRFGYPSAAALSPADGDPLRANFRKNYPQTSADWIAQGNLQGSDLAFYIAPPGRFPTGAGPDGHMDLAGAVFNGTSTFTGSATVTLDMISRWSRSGSWETAHAIPYPTHVSGVLRKYWAQGGRCVKN